MNLHADDFTRLYRAHARALVAYFARRVFDPEAAVDLTADTFTAAFSGRAQFRGASDEDAMRWIYGIARNQVAGFYRAGSVERDAMRRVGVERRALTDLEFERIEELSAVASIGQRVTTALAAMPAEHAEVLQLRVVEELGYSEIADRFSISEQTARARVSRALRALATRVEPYVAMEEAGRA